MKLAIEWLVEIVGVTHVAVRAIMFELAISF